MNYCRCEEAQFLLQGLRNYRSESLPAMHEALTCGSEHSGHVKLWHEAWPSISFSAHVPVPPSECSKGAFTAPLHLSQGAAVEWGINVWFGFVGVFFLLHLHPKQHYWPLPKPMWL